MNISPVIVVPVYKKFQNLDREELISFNRLLLVLSQYSVVLFGPSTIDYIPYLKKAEEENVELKIEYFENSFFENVSSYSKLLLSCAFYERFQQYTHMLIYQLDAYVFEDQLMNWCDAGYDYIGAPWIEDKSGKHIKGEITGVGNGGFCLRNISKCKNVLSSTKPFKTFRELKNEYKEYSIFELLLRYPKILYRSWFGYKNTGHYYASRSWRNEDSFWGTSVLNSRYPFRIAPVNEAIKFSFEVAPEYLYKTNKEVLPFGCHAWEKYQPEFWANFIPGLSQKYD